MRLNKSATLFAGVLIAATLTTGTASASTADISNLELGAFGYNAYGADTAANRNAEYIDIKNTHATDALNVKGLVVEDAWRHGQPDSYTGRCNRYTVTTIPDGGRDGEELPAGHTLRVYVGAGSPRVFGTRHDVFMDSPTRCGYNGHIFNNGPGSSSRAPWDTVWVKVGAATESKSYNFSFGYWVS
ncbi:hypothetical protein [Nonomuraea sp. NPDC050643]|uniref:hypothetical protein n=1 Tax=Nonomuraea sp. NPDC050643 TaxID=3155660 RepID=UPI00340507FD